MRRTKQEQRQVTKQSRKDRGLCINCGGKRAVKSVFLNMVMVEQKVLSQCVKCLQRQFKYQQAIRKGGVK